MSSVWLYLLGCCVFAITWMALAGIAAGRREADRPALMDPHVDEQLNAYGNAVDTHQVSGGRWTGEQPYDQAAVELEQIVNGDTP